MSAQSAVALDRDEQLDSSGVSRLFRRARDRVGTPFGLPVCSHLHRLPGLKLEGNGSNVEPDEA